MRRERAVSQAAARALAAVAQLSPVTATRGDSSGSGSGSGSGSDNDSRDGGSPQQLGSSSPPTLSATRADITTAPVSRPASAAGLTANAATTPFDSTTAGTIAAEAASALALHTATGQATKARPLGTSQYLDPAGTSKATFVAVVTELQGTQAEAEAGTTRAEAISAAAVASLAVDALTPASNLRSKET